MSQNIDVTATAKTIKDSDKIVVKSLKPNVYYTCPKTMDTFIWAEVGEVQSMTFAQIKLMKNKHKGYFTKKMLYPQNEAAIEKLGLNKIFAIKFERKDWQVLFGNNVEEAREKIGFVPASERAAFIKKVENYVKQGRIVNIKIIKLLEKEFDVELMSLV
ncbi:MAG: hypothetical protein IJA34_00955 [Lachnospiraceae bacterium]|nr:hypothetical protein [Lachnospiraceae bacterium]